MLGGKVLDLAWNGESNRLAVVGEGQPPAKVIMWDSGNSVGDMSGHTKKVNAVAFRQSRPFRIATAGEDKMVRFYEGPPFKASKERPMLTSKEGDLTTHSNFANTVRYSPDDSKVLSASNDMTVALFDGKDGAPLKAAKVHAGTIYAAEWSPDGKCIATASGDKSVKILDDGLATMKEVNLCAGAKPDAGDMQVGCVWATAGIVSYSLGSDLSIIDPESGAVTATQVGHNQSVSALLWAKDRLLSGSFATWGEGSGSKLWGVVRTWDLSTGLASSFAGEGHTNRVLSLGLFDDGTILSCGLDNCLIASTLSPQPQHGAAKVQLDACPVSMGVGGKLAAVVTTASTLLLVTRDKLGTAPSSIPLSFEPACVAVAPDGGAVAVGGADNKVRLLTAAGGEEKVLDKHIAAISCLAYAPGSKRLASGCANKEIVIWDVGAGTPLSWGLQGFHPTRITCLTFSAAGVLASGGVDGSIIVWGDLPAGPFKPPPKHKLHGSTTHAGGVSALAFVGDGAVLASAGLDACIKTWTVA